MKKFLIILFVCYNYYAIGQISKQIQIDYIDSLNRIISIEEKFCSGKDVKYFLHTNSETFCLERKVKTIGDTIIINEQCYTVKKSILENLSTADLDYSIVEEVSDGLYNKFEANKLVNDSINYIGAILFEKNKLNEFISLISKIKQDRVTAIHNNLFTIDYDSLVLIKSSETLIIDSMIKQIKVISQITTINKNCDWKDSCIVCTTQYENKKTIPQLISIDTIKFINKKFHIQMNGMNYIKKQHYKIDYITKNDTVSTLYDDSLYLKKTIYKSIPDIVFDCSQIYYDDYFQLLLNRIADYQNRQIISNTFNDRFSTHYSTIFDTNNSVKEIILSNSSGETTGRIKYTYY